MSQTDESRQILAARSAADGAFVPALPRRSAFWLLFALFLVTAKSTDCGTPPIPASASYIRSLSGSFLLLHVSSMAFLIYLYCCFHCFCSCHIVPGDLVLGFDCTGPSDCANTKPTLTGRCLRHLIVFRECCARFRTYPCFQRRERVPWERHHHPWQVNMLGSKYCGINFHSHDAFAYLAHDPLQGNANITKIEASNLRAVNGDLTISVRIPCNMC